MNLSPDTPVAWHYTSTTVHFVENSNIVLKHGKKKNVKAREEQRDHISDRIINTNAAALLHWKPLAEDEKKINVRCSTK